MTDFTHFDDKGNARMVDISDKNQTERIAIAKGKIYVGEEILNRIKEGNVEKGDVLAVARVAGIMAAKNTSLLIPMCHPILLTGVDLDFNISEKGYIEAEAKVKTTGKTGVEMEALNSCSVALLTIYDMCKAIDKSMIITDISLEYKSGGKSGIYKKCGD
ncbi:MAG: cyclic pyranopterin monophosphate synthase MoaC [Tissierellia bacterium]|nr:cyclic pyranopterin monophosphate synthase MoaC [Tissierellia bacterium]